MHQRKGRPVDEMNFLKQEKRQDRKEGGGAMSVYGAYKANILYFSALLLT